MAGPLRVLLAGPAATTTGVGDIDGGPLASMAIRSEFCKKKMLVVK
jgi:hypothetical protein